MKWIFLLLLIVTHNPLWAATQYSEASCDGLKRQKEQIRKRLNAGYGFAEGEWLDRQDRALFQKIATHCTAPVASSSSKKHAEDTDGQDSPQARQTAQSAYADVSLQDMPDWSAHNAIFKGDKVAAWTEFYQVPTRCRQKKLSEEDFVACADHKALQRQQFEQRWQTLKFSPVTAGSAQAVASTPAQQPVIESIPAYAVESANSRHFATLATQTTSVAAITSEPTSRYAENIQQQFHWVGLAFLVLIAGVGWFIWRQ